VPIPAAFIQDLLARVDVVELVGRYVPLKKGGANFMGLCPFHSEKTPSFTVSPSKQFFHCFGCGKSGDAIAFLMEHAGLGFAEAVRDLAAHVGMSVPQEHASAAERQAQAQHKQRQATLAEVLQKAAAAYSQHLQTSPQAAAYLRQRGIAAASAQRFALGYAPAGWRTLASVFAHYDDASLEEAGLVVAHTAQDAPGKRYDRFRHRVMFPIRNVKGEYVGFGARALGEEKPKYLNSPETPLFHKGRELYGLYEARTALRDSGHVLVVEGYMDVIALAQRGFANTVATLGTACTDEHVRKLFRFTSALVFSFDGDASGRNAARKALLAALPHASDTRSVKFLFLPAEHDPDSYIRAHGPQAFARCVATALPLSRFLLDTASDGCDLAQAEGRAHMASKARTLWGALPDGALKQQLLGDIAARVQLPARDLADIWVRQSPRQTAASRHGSSAASRATPTTPRRPARTHASAYAAAPRAWPGGPAGNTGAARLDQAARLLIVHMALMEELGSEDWDALAHEAGAHGALFRWLEAQFQEAGSRPFALLREQLRCTAHEPLVARLMDGPLGQVEGDLPELRRELRDLLNRLLRERIAAQTAAIAARASGDPSAAEQLRQLYARRLALEGQISAAQ